jgi:hypothetical protein
MPVENAKRMGRPTLGPDPGPSGLVGLRMASDQKQQMKQAAAEAGIPFSELLRRALQEKIARDDEMKTGARDLLQEAKIGKPKTAPTMMMHTSERDVRHMLLQEAARFHAAGAPEKAALLLAEYHKRYQVDEKFRAEIDAGVRQSLRQAEKLKARTLPLGSSEGRH